MGCLAFITVRYLVWRGNVQRVVSFDESELFGDELGV